jgi:hypothetical protein
MKIGAGMTRNSTKPIFSQLQGEPGAKVSFFVDFYQQKVLKNIISYDSEKDDGQKRAGSLLLLFWLL